MKALLINSCVIALLFSCNSGQSDADNSTAGQTQNTMIAKNSCFISASSTDTVWLKIEVFPNVVTGILKYQFFEKDQNQGTIDGHLEGSILYADYTFQSEGSISVREVAFLLESDKVTEGFGEVEVKDGKQVFKDRSSIIFSDGLTFNRIDCIENDARFSVF